ncbi:MAG TPA: preprotein translocase subunit SecY, partial [Archaeoglobus veneficus]|nr:preprotein translocase subunit SecY [Archaeoglobus veneficus]
SGMDAKTVASQIAKSGMQVPGFRKSPQVLERILQRYIPKLTVLGGAAIGILTLIANVLGTIGHVSGTGLLLAVSIAYRFYEDLAKEQLTEMHPMLRKFLGEEV